MEHQTQSASFQLTPDLVLTLLTWLTFFGLLFILKKFAFKPALDALKKREQYIQESLDKADSVKAQFTEMEQIKARHLEEAKAQAAQIIQEARVTARAVAEDIEKKAKQHAESIAASSYAQIAGEYQRVSKQLKQESAQTAIALAGKILKENLDTDKNKKLIESAIESL